MRNLLTTLALSFVALTTGCQEEIKTPHDESEEEVPVVEEDPVVEGPLVIDLGEVTTGRDITFEIPEGALGFNLVVEGEAADFDPYRPFGIESIEDPEGNVVHENYAPVGGRVAMSVAIFDSIASVSVPQSEKADAIRAGTWTARFGVAGATTSTKRIPLRGTVRVQSSGDGAFHGGLLDLHLHIPKGLRVDNREVDADVERLKEDPALADRVDAFFDLTSELLGIERGDVVFHVEDASFRFVDDEELLDAFAVAKGEEGARPALHILMTNAIRQDGEVVAAGMAPGIPGAVGVLGRRVSTIVVSTYRLADDILSMIHEMGHFVGLSHTTEFDGELWDPLADTPRCIDIAELNPHQYRSCPDSDNVMFPTGALESTPTLSKTQKRVYRGSPIYRAYVADAVQTRSLRSKSALPALGFQFRQSNGPLSAIERELSAGFCGLNKLDPQALVRRHGLSATVEQLRAAAVDADLSPVIQGRARLALKALGVQP